MELNALGTKVIEKWNDPTVTKSPEPGENFAEFAMQALAVQKSFTKSKKEDPFLEKFTNLPQPVIATRNHATGKHSTDMTCDVEPGSRNKTHIGSMFLDPYGQYYLLWLLVMSLAVAYSYWTIILRIAFIEGQGRNFTIFIIFDYATDILYLLDIWIQTRTGYMENGLLVIEIKKIRWHYMRTVDFCSDCVAILPFDLLYFVYGINPVFRLGRLLKSHRFLSFYQRVTLTTNHHNMFNLLMLIHHVFLIIHWVACIYFIISKGVGFGSEPWVYPALRGEWRMITRQYLYCFYLSSVTMTYVGNVPTPETPVTLLAVIVMYLVGVLVFAVIVGSACDMITRMTIERAEFQRKMNEINNYMLAHHVPSHLQKRVIKWFDYLWMEKIDFIDEETFELLPDSCKAELLLHVNLDTLKKVEIFEDCEPSLLRELVLRLQHTQCCPGDYICEQGEVGCEMYIVHKGHLDVEVDGQKVATMSPGNYFGEISILNIDGVGNRRTASIRSIGFSELFKLSKNDLKQVLKDYPNARSEMEEKAGEILKKDRERKRSTCPEDETQDNSNLMEPSGWLFADCATLHEQVRKVQMQLKEKKLKTIKENIKKRKEEKNQQMISSFVKQNPYHPAKLEEPFDVRDDYQRDKLSSLEKISRLGDLLSDKDILSVDYRDTASR